MNRRQIQFRVRPELRPKLACASMDCQFVWTKWGVHAEAERECRRLNAQARRAQDAGNFEGALHIFEFRVKPSVSGKVRNGRVG